MLFFPIIVILLFYFFAVLQSSFFAYFTFFGVIPNLVFNFFILVLFFSVKKAVSPVIIYAICAGFFLDILYGTPFGVCILTTLLIGLVGKKMQRSFLEERDLFPLSHFVLMYLFSLFVFQFIILMYGRFLSPQHINIILDFRFLFGVMYNLAVAVGMFYLYKKVTLWLKITK